MHSPLDVKENSNSSLYKVAVNSNQSNKQADQVKIGAKKDVVAQFCEADDASSREEFEVKDTMTESERLICLEDGE